MLFQPPPFLHQSFVEPRLRPALTALLLVTCSTLMLALIFHYGLQFSGFVADLIINLALAYWLNRLLRSTWLAVSVQALLTGMLYLSFGFKLYYFSEPLAPDDLKAVSVLLTQGPFWVRAAILVPGTGLLLLLVFGLRRRWQTPAWLAGGILAVAVPLMMFYGPLSHSIDYAFGYKAYAQLADFKARGPYLYLMDEYMRDRVSIGQIPGRGDVVKALDAQAPVNRLASAPVITKPRNIYVIMMETLWDPSLLQRSALSADPLAPGFRQLYEQAGRSKVMVPVFGGGTPNSEFEALCGLPAFETRIVFMNGMNSDITCLPRILTAAGYHTYAATAVDYGVWKRGDAFQALGFERFYDSDNYQLDDLNGQFLSDKSLFSQTDQLLKRDGLPGPRFTYICSGSGHYPFELNEQRPMFIRTSSVLLVTSYVNAIYYDTLDLAAYIAQLRERDPDAVIVAFGDHLPVLGGGLNVYARSHLMTRKEEDFTPAMLETHQSTPILVIDGQRGPLRLGRISLFELPRLLLSLIGAQGATDLDAFAPPAGLHPRPYHGRLLVVPDTGDPVFCTPESQDGYCAQVVSWYQKATLLRKDMVNGSDYTDLILYGAKSAPPHTAAMTYLSDIKPEQHKRQHKR
jgi:phosphoglycerol transferase MdoB-like AlkP superfamily enzyme